MLHRRAALPVLLSIAFFCPPEVGADEPKTAEELVARHIEALGGPTKLDSITTVRIEGKSSFGTGSTNSRTEILFKRPQKLHMDMTHEGKTIIQGFDGSTGWAVMTSAGQRTPIPVSPDVIELMKDRADLRGPLVDHEAKGYRIALSAKTEINGSECYGLRVTKAGGAVEHYFLDAKSFLIVQVKGKRKSRGGEKEYTINFGDYRDVDGLMVAQTVQGDGLTGDMTVERVELNLLIPDSLFRKP